MLFFPDPEPSVIYIMYEWSGICRQFGLCFFCLFVSFRKASLFCIGLLSYCILISFSHLLDLSSFHMCVSIRSNDCIISSLFEPKTVLLISSVKTLCHSLLNLCCVFNIILLLLWIFVWSLLRLSMSVWFFSRCFILFLS